MCFDATGTPKHTYTQPYAHIKTHIHAHIKTHTHTCKHIYTQPYAKLGGTGLFRPLAGGDSELKDKHRTPDYCQALRHVRGAVQIYRLSDKSKSCYQETPPEPPLFLLRRCQSQDWTREGCDATGLCYHNQETIYLEVALYKFHR